MGGRPMGSKVTTMNEAVAELPAPNPLRAHVRATIAPDLRKRIERSDGTAEAYDLASDPGERHDLAR